MRDPRHLRLLPCRRRRRHSCLCHRRRRHLTATTAAAAVHCTATGQIIVKRILTWAHVKSCEKNTNEEDFLSFRFLNLTFVSCATKEIASLKPSFFIKSVGKKNLIQISTNKKEVFWTYDWFLLADMTKKDTLKLDYSLLDDSKLESLGLWWLKRVVRTYYLYA